MELRQLEYFIAVAEAGGFSQASKVLGVAQSALSRQTSLLERELGAQLLYRHGRGIRMTTEGQGFYRSVAPVVRGLLDARDEIRAGAMIPGGNIALGMGLTFASTIGADVVRTFRSRFPQVRLRVDLLVGLLDSLSSGLVDMAISSHAHRVPTLHSTPLFKADLFLIGATRELAAIANDDETIDAQRLDGLPLILVGHRRGLRHELDLMAEQIGIGINVVVETNALISIIDLVRDNVGMTVLPYGAVVAPHAGQPLAARHIVSPSLALNYELAYSRQRQRTLTMRELENTVREETLKALADGRLRGQAA